MMINKGTDLLFEVAKVNQNNMFVYGYPTDPI